MTNLRPAMEIIGEEMADNARETFESQGRRGGGSWTKLSEKRMREKAREKIDPRIEFGETHRLYVSLAQIGSPENKLIIKGSANTWAVALGTTVPYAKAQHRGVPSRNLPARKLYKSVPGDVVRFERIIVQYFWDAYTLKVFGSEGVRPPRGHFSA